MSGNEREFEIIVQGATGFTGRLVAEYLLGRYGVADQLRWAIGGRSQQKLEALRDELGREAGVDTSALPIVLGDAADRESMTALARRTQVMCTTVGPYAKYGSELVAACAREGTDYCDLTGEVPWMRQMIEQHQDAAATHGARIVHNCGFDCIPSDLGVFFIQREMQARHGVACSKVKLRVNGFSGGASGGTIASMIHMMEEAERDPEIMRAMNEPYALNPKDQQSGPDGPERRSPSWDEDFKQWTAPFVMAGINTKVVRRSNALLGYAYGKGFEYDEAILSGSGPLGMAKAAGASAATGGGMAAMAIGPLRRLVQGRLPAPGEGPSKEKREAGYFDLLLLGIHPTDRKLDIHARITGDRDPGYGSTSKMLGESAVCLARDPLTVGGGFWTPAAAMGEPLLKRLQERAGVTFTVDEGHQAR